MGVNGAVEGVVIQSDNPLSYDETGEFPPYDGIDADTLEGHPADDFMLKEEYNPTDLSEYLKESEADTKYATKSHTHSISDVSNLQTTLNSKANSSHTHSASQISAGTFSGNVVAKSGGAVGTKMIRNIYAGTNDIGVGASLSTGDIYLVYE